ncbi:MAG: serpin family protein [Gemmatimonadota bacterium]|jgi:serpin B
MSRPKRRHVRLAALAASVLLPLTAWSCGSDITGPEPITELPRDLSVTEQSLVEAGNAFAVRLLQQVHRADPDRTVFLSPLSASMALGMTLNGAAGETRDQMRAALGFGSMPMTEVDRAYRNLMDLLVGLDDRVEVQLANAIFHRDSFQMEPTFLDTVRTYFDARVQGLDFADPSAAEDINAWVREATHGRIDGMVDPPISPLTMAFLMNAVYFKGDWTRKFDAAKTYTGPFHLPGGSTRDVRFMTKSDTVSWRSGDGWDAVELPYGGGAFVMTLAVPHADATLDAVAGDLASILDPDATWGTLKLDVHVPRFQLSYERVLNDDLEALGMLDAFDPGRADFTPMFSGALEAQLHISKVKQKTFLKVDEEGTEAAAVTSVEVGVTSVPMAFRADRPFLLAIRERLSGTVLFAGFIVDAPTD